MSRFRSSFQATFGQDFPESSVSLQLPRLRFELAHGPEQSALTNALHRCRLLHEAAFRGASTIRLEIRFWDGERAPPAEQQIKRLESRGLVPASGEQWEWDVLRRIDDGDEIVERRCSASIPADSPGLEPVFRTLIWSDFGGYEDFGFLALLADFDRAVGFCPYDDRGADLFSVDVSLLRPIYFEFESWILDWDRPRIIDELELDAQVRS